jgi:CubicO group peptidase (beta-lactamase class C family)
MSPLLGAALFLLGVAIVPRARAAEAPLKNIEHTISQALKDWEVPGLAIAVVKDDAVVLVRGYGVRKLGGAAPVDEHTLFAIGSVAWQGGPVMGR